jgi:uncharacterized protein YggE
MKISAFPLVLFGILISCQASAEGPKSTVEVRATGTVSVSSDTVVQRLSVATANADPQQAKKRNDQIAAPIYKLAESQHINRPALLATNVSFDFVQKQAEMPKVQLQIAQQAPPIQQGNLVPGNESFQSDKKGYQQAPGERAEPPIFMSRLCRDLEIRFRDLNQAVAFLTAITKWDCVHTSRELTLGPLCFDVANRSNHLVEARRRAVASATAKARLLAEQNGLKLGVATLIYDESSEASRTSVSLLPEIPTALPGHDDPFGASTTEKPARATSAAIRLVAMEGDVVKTLDLDRLPPTQVTITASVRIVFEVNKP